MFLRVTGRLYPVIVNRSEEERRAIAAEVIAARGAQPITRAAAQAGITPVTWRRIEKAQPVREDILERVSAYVSDRTHKPPQTVVDATDEQLLAELGRRLAQRHQSGSENGPSMKPGLHAEVLEDSPTAQAVQAGPERRRISSRAQRHTSGP